MIRSRPERGASTEGIAAARNSLQEERLVYVVAAYSITLSVLLIYGVLLQYRARLAAPRSRTGFNLGAALLTPLWALCHGQRAAGAVFVAAAVGLVAAKAMGQALAVSLLGAVLLGGALYFGVVGNRIAEAAAAAAAAAAGAAGAEPVARARAQLRWALAGAVIHTLVLPWACYFWLARGALPGAQG